MLNEICEDDYLIRVALHRLGIAGCFPPIGKLFLLEKIGIHQYLDVCLFQDRFLPSAGLIQRCSLVGLPIIGHRQLDLLLLLGGLVLLGLHRLARRCLLRCHCHTSLLAHKHRGAMGEEGTRAREWQATALGLQSKCERAQ